MSKGWYKQPYRHSLAARGISTKTPVKTTQASLDHFTTQKTINWDLTTTDYSIFDDSIKHPTNPHRKFNCELRWLTPDEFIDFQYKSIARFYKNTHRPMEESTKEMFWSGYYPDHARKVQDHMLSGEKIPSFVIEIDDEGITSFQEGRHRVIVAKKLGIPEVPVWFCTRRN